MIYIFPSELTYQHIAAIHDELLTFFNQFEQSGNKKVFFDFNQISDLDITGLQLLLSLHKTINQQQYSFAFLNKSAYLQEMLDLSGATDLLSDDNF